jgi:ribosomal protein S6--L-glutamate ligase
MNIYLITENAQLYAPQRIIQEAKRFKHSLRIINPRKSLLQATQLNKKLSSTIVLHRSNGIHFDDFDLALSFAFEAGGAKVYNSPRALLLFRDKLQQLVLLSKLNLPTIKWAAERDSSSESLIKEMKKYGPPYIYKTQRGNKGIGVHHFTKTSGLKAMLKNSDQRFILQNYINADFELRCFFIGKKYWFLRKNKNSKGTHHFEENNFFLASKDEEKLIRNYCKKIITACAFFSGAIDFLVTKDRPYFLELNANPGFQALEQLSGENIASILLQEIVTDAQKD